MPSLQELLVASSRTFAVGIRILPEPLSTEVTVAYLLLRVSDYLEDNRELRTNEKVALLQNWRRVLAGDGERRALVERLREARDDTPDALVARQSATVLAGLDGLAAPAKEILIRRVGESSAGMARWTE
ncbi:MAG: squalene/phytoene synthase family protein, partial [Gemmatimonadota bacterium]|nr:squalene/phytoene synthase family protein [Gemmatimonadota bacterium]